MFKRFVKHIVVFLGLTATTAFFFLHPAGDSDLFWHLKTGEIIWHTKSIPFSDIFSFTALGRPWVNHEWLAEVLLYAVVSFGGFRSLSFFLLMLGMGIAASLFLTLRKLSGQEFMALFLVFVVCFLGAPRFAQLRPEIFAILIFSVILGILACGGFKSCKTPLILPLLAIWANLHASVVLGAGVFLIYYIGSLREGFCLRSFMLFLGGLLAPLINPFGVGIYTFPFRHAAENFALSVVSDWGAPAFFGPHHDLLVWGFVILICIGLVLAIANPKKTDWPLFIIAIVLCVPVFRWVRFLPFAAVALVFLVAGLISARSGTFNFAVLALCLGLPIFSGHESPIYGMNEQDFPVQATDFIERQNFEGQIFNDMAWGGYLIWRGYPKIRVFIDTRTPVYGDAFIKEYSDALFSRTAFDKVREKYNIGYVLYDLREIRAPNGPLEFLFADPQWAPAFKTPNSIVFKRVGTFPGL